MDTINSRIRLVRTEKKLTQKAFAEKLNMSEQEKKTAKEVIDSLKQIPPDGADYVRGYLQGRLDGLKKEKEDKA